MIWWRIGVVVSAVGWALTPRTHPAVTGFFILGWVVSLVGLFTTDRR